MVHESLKVILQHTNLFSLETFGLLYQIDMILYLLAISDYYILEEECMDGFSSIDD